MNYTLDLYTCFCNIFLKENKTICDVYLKSFKKMDYKSYLDNNKLYCHTKHPYTGTKHEDVPAL